MNKGQNFYQLAEGRDLRYSCAGQSSRATTACPFNRGAVKEYRLVNRKRAGEEKCRPNLGATLIVHNECSSAGPRSPRHAARIQKLQRLFSR